MAYGFRTAHRSGNLAQPSEYRPGREVYPSAQIPHLWAHGLPQSARVRNGNVHAHGADIYSYSTIMGTIIRVPISRLTDQGAFTGAGDDSGQAFVYLVNSRRYSVTTCGHQSCIRSAIPVGAMVFHLPPSIDGARGDRANLWDSLKERKAGPILDYFNDQAACLIREAMAPRIRAATRQAKLDALAALPAQFARIRAVFAIRCKPDAFKLPATMTLEAVKELAAKNAAKAAKQTARAQRAAEIAAKRAAARVAQDDHDLRTAGIVDAWRRGERDTPHARTDDVFGRTVRLSYPVLRLVPAQSDAPGDHTSAAATVQTSLGAVVPADDARRVLALLPRLVRELNRRDDAAEVGQFRGMTATADSLIIGCHSIPWHEVRAFCEFVGWELPEGTPPMPGTAADGKAVA